MNHVPFEKDLHYPLVYAWWKKHNNAVLSPTLLPKNGVLVLEDEVPVLANWIYDTDSKLTMIGWTVSNPESGPRTRVRALEYSVRVLEEAARDSGYEHIISFASPGAMIKLMERNGFTKLEHHEFLLKDIGKYGHRISALRGDQPLPTSASVVGEEKLPPSRPSLPS